MKSSLNHAEPRVSVCVQRSAHLCARCDAAIELTMGRPGIKLRYSFREGLKKASGRV